jgi:hypothetical protein
LNQKKYIEIVLKRFNMQDNKPVKVPDPVIARLTDEQCPKTQKEINDMEHVPYASVVGTLMYVMVFNQPNISHAVGLLRR